MGIVAHSLRSSKERNLLKQFLVNSFYSLDNLASRKMKASSSAPLKFFDFSNNSNKCSLAGILNIWHNSNYQLTRCYYWTQANCLVGHLSNLSTLIKMLHSLVNYDSNNLLLIIWILNINIRCRERRRNIPTWLSFINNVSLILQNTLEIVA